MRNPQEPREGVTGHLSDEDLSECAFSPEQASADAVEHAAGCAECAARIEELHGIVAALADLPEPEIPASVVARLDATLEQAWQEADETALALARSTPRREKKHHTWWRRLAVPITALAVFAGGVVGIGYLITRAGSLGSAASSAGVASNGNAVKPDAAPVADPTLVAMAREVITPDMVNGSDAGPTGRNPSTPATSMQRFSEVECGAPAKAGFAIETIVAETYAGRDARLVVYRDDKEPAYSTTFYVVLYAGSCPIESSAVLDQGLVSFSR